MVQFIVGFLISFPMKPVTKKIGKVIELMK